MTRFVAEHRLLVYIAACTTVAGAVGILDLFMNG